MSDRYVYLILRAFYKFHRTVCFRRKGHKTYNSAAAFVKFAEKSVIRSLYVRRVLRALLALRDKRTFHIYTYNVRMIGSEAVLCG